MKCFPLSCNTLAYRAIPLHQLVVRRLQASANSFTELCWAQVQMNSKRYWKRAINLSFPLLLARNREKYVDKLVAFSTSFLVSSPVRWAPIKSYDMDLTLRIGGMILQSMINVKLYKQITQFKRVTSLLGQTLNQHTQQRRSFQRCIIQFLLTVMSADKSCLGTRLQGEASLLKKEASPCDEYSLSSSKRLFSSVFQMLDSDQAQVSKFQQEQTNGNRISAILKDDNLTERIMSRIHSDVVSQGVAYPVLKVQCADPAYCANASIDYYDLEFVFSHFGEVNRVIMGQHQEAYIFFNCFSNAFIAYKFFQHIDYFEAHPQLCLSWVKPQEYPLSLLGCFSSYTEQLKQRAIMSSSLQLPKQNKFTCRYEIQIENQREFQVARRIIGAKGCNMKKIIEDSLNAIGTVHRDFKETLKLRLRGQGSGYKEGPDQLESAESLHLCISAKDEASYQQACIRVEKHLQRIYSEYLEFTSRNGQGRQLKIKKLLVSQFNQQEGIQSIQMVKNDFEYRIAPGQISELLELRNKARRELNFIEADRIRNYLRNCGVCLIDEKGRRGKATDVTNWKYMF